MVGTLSLGTNSLTMINTISTVTSLVSLSPSILNSLVSNYTNYLTALPSTANFTTLTVGGNTVATQSWVTSNGYLTTLQPTSPLLLWEIMQ